MLQGGSPILGEERDQPGTNFHEAKLVPGFDHKSGPDLKYVPTLN